MLVVSGLQFGPEWISLPASAAPGEATLDVMTWNIEVGASTAAEIVDPVLASRAEVVGLQELTPRAAAFLEADPRILARFPYRVLVPEATTLGLGLLSAFPIGEHESRANPRGVWAAITARGGSVDILVVHPLPGQIEFAGSTGLAVGFDARDRDARLAGVRGWIDALLAGKSDPRLVVFGDFNVTPTERGYGLVAAGLRDAHREAGLGPGWTWRPSVFEHLDMAFLRIDYVLSSPSVRPLSSSVDCGLPADHCALEVELGLGLGLP